MTGTSKTKDELFVKMVLDNWSTFLARVDNLLDELSDEQLESELAPGRNRGVYILGHLTAAHDRILPLLGLGQPVFPELEDMFLKTPDRAAQSIPTTPTLRESWTVINRLLHQQIKKLSTTQWFERHMSISEADFKKEPHRNRLNVMISRANHLAYHYGQLVLLKPRK
jgi:hypothetical protein